MKYIDLSFIPFKVSKKYSNAIKEIRTDKEIVLFEKFKTNVNIFKNLINKVNIQFNFYDLENINEIDSLLIDLYGLPKYYHINSNMKVWVYNKIYITHGLVETRYNDVIHIISISLLKPPFILSYDKFVKYDEINKLLKQTYNFKRVNDISIGISKEVRFIYETINKVYLVCIYKNKLDIIISMKTDNRIKPYNKVNYKFNNNKEIYDILNNFFKNQIVYDKELYK